MERVRVRGFPRETLIRGCLTSYHCYYLHYRGVSLLAHSQTHMHAQAYTRNFAAICPVLHTVSQPAESSLCDTSSYFQSFLTSPFVLQIAIKCKYCCGLLPADITGCPSGRPLLVLNKHIYTTANMRTDSEWSSSRVESICWSREMEAEFLRFHSTSMLEFLELRSIVFWSISLQSQITVHDSLITLQLMHSTFI